MKKAIIIGASSGIGKALALELSKREYVIGLCARRLPLLEEVASACPSKTFIKQLDAQNAEEMRKKTEELIAEMQGVDIIIYNSGIGESSSRWEKEEPMHLVNAVGFAAIANLAYYYFKKNNIKGQIVGVSSVAGARGMRHTIGYGATKSFMWTYMEGLRHQAAFEKNGISITDIRPGFIDTDMTKGQKGMFWVATSEKAAIQIADAIEQKKKVAYITKRWRIVAKLFKLLPDFVLHKS